MFHGIVTNSTLLENPDLCTIDTCPMSMANVKYIPSLGGNLLFIVIFALAAVVQIGLGIRYKTWTYMVSMLGGLILEVIGYVARVQMHNNPFQSGPFLMYLVCLTIGPAFLSAAIYLCLSRIVVTYGEAIAYLRPRTYTILFITCDFIALVLQALGGGIASSANTSSGKTLGKNIMIAGVSWQVASLALFMGLSVDLALRIRKASPSLFNYKFNDLRVSRRFTFFLVSLATATLTIFIRSVFRCAELSEGFDGAMANDQVTFMVLEGAMIAIAVIGLTVFHPGLVWKGQWAEAIWHVRAGSEGKVNYDNVTSDSSVVGINLETRPTGNRYYGH